jgi:hypothetical protein
MRFATIAATVIAIFVSVNAMAADYKIGSLEIMGLGHVPLRKELQQPSAT